MNSHGVVLRESYSEARAASNPTKALAQEAESSDSDDENDKNSDSIIEINIDGATHKRNKKRK